MLKAVKYCVLIEGLFCSEHMGVIVHPTLSINPAGN